MEDRRKQEAGELKFSYLLENDSKAALILSSYII